MREGGYVTRGLLMNAAQKERIRTRGIDAAEARHCGLKSTFAHHIHDLIVIIAGRTVGIAEVNDRRLQLLFEPRLGSRDLLAHTIPILQTREDGRSEERRVGKEC